MLDRWLAEAVAAAGGEGLELPPDAADVILALAGDAAHAIERPAAPLAAFAAGVAVARGADLREAAAAIAAAAEGFSP